MVRGRPRAYISLVRFHRKPVVVLAVVPIAALAIIFVAAAVRVHSHLSPEHLPPSSIDFAAMEIEVESVPFEAADGLALRGWMMRGDGARPAIVLSHDRASGKSSLVNLAIGLRELGFTILMIDFRGHGESEQRLSTLGLREMRDVLGAVDVLQSMDWLDDRRVGLYGVGMGAHAAVLAAAELPAVKVLVLDSLYPDPSYTMVRSFYGDWPFAVKRLSFLPRATFRLLTGEDIDGRRAADIIGRLPGRDMLLLASEGDAELIAELKGMYLTIPDQTDVDGNLVFVPAAQTEALYGERLEEYTGTVAAFFDQRLGGER
jgi:pimeloyl-ACP methyl ester carboxylesterase